MPRRGAQAAAAGGQGQQDAGWQPVHRFAFVQELLRKGCMPESSALDTFEQLTGLSSVDDFHAMIAEQNSEMGSLSLQIRTLLYPVDKQTYVGFINTMADEPSKLATHYTPGQREFFKHVLETIAADPDAEGGVGSASSMQLLNMDLSRPAAGQDAEGESAQAAVAAAKKLTKTDKDNTLRQLVADNWLKHNETRSGFYFIGVRSFMELSELLLSFDVPDATRDAWNNIL